MKFIFRTFFTALVVLLSNLCAYEEAFAQIKEASEEDPLLNLGKSQVVRYRVGTSLTASRGPVKNVFAMMAVPLDCAEQRVQIAVEDISPEVDAIEYRMLDGGVRQMLISIPYLPAGKEAHAIVTFDVTTSAIRAPDEELTEQLVVPQKPDRQLKKYLGRSEFIQTNDSKIRKTLRKIFEDNKDLNGETAGEEDVHEDRVSLDGEADSSVVDIPADNETNPEQQLTPWQRVEKIYDYVQSSIQYVEGDDKSALDALNDGYGDCHDISALFVALCRTEKIPARMVWVHEHQYPEFCLADAEGELHWFPCESAGMRAFGEMPTPRVIMQKGDLFRVPERPRERFHYASEYMTVDPVPGSGRPKQHFIREQL